MTRSVRTWDEIEQLLRRATRELERAARASAVAARYDRLVRRAPPESPLVALHRRMATIHHQLGRRHLTAATIHRAHAERLRRFLGSEAEGIPPAFMAAVAETSGADSALLSLFGHGQVEAIVVTSDKMAAEAHDLESTLDEGPARDAAAGHELVAARDGALEERWPLYGPAAVRLGIRAAAAVPLGIRGQCLGTLTVFGAHVGARARGKGGAASLGTVADALTHTMLLGGDPEASADDVPALPLEGDGDQLAVVHQAAGMLAGESGCRVGDALAIIRAHAFAQSEPVHAVAARVVSRSLHLGTVLN